MKIYNIIIYQKLTPLKNLNMYYFIIMGNNKQIKIIKLQNQIKEFLINISIITKI